MKKIILSSFVLLSLLSLSACSKSTSNMSLWSWYILDNYYNNHLDLREQNLTQIPSICADITWDMIYNIWSLDLSNNQLQKINYDLSCLPNLKELNLSYNQISKIQNLDNLSSLSKLELQTNKLTSTKWLQKLSSLKELNLWYNEILDIKSLSNMTNILDLQLQHNQISDISDLSNLSNLESLKLEYNQISDESQLTTISKFPNLKRISLWMNQLPEGKVVELQERVNVVE